MSIHEKLAARLGQRHVACGHCGSVALQRAIEDVRAGECDGILGVRAPTIEDVERETKRVSGRDDATVKDWGGAVVVRVFTLSSSGKLTMPLCVEAPSVPSAYAALRALPDYEGEK